MDHDQVQKAMQAGDLTEAVITPAKDANGWVILITNLAGEHTLYTDHTGSEKVCHSLDQATGVVRELGFETIRVEEDF